MFLETNFSLTTKKWLLETKAKVRNKQEKLAICQAIKQTKQGAE